MPYRFRSLTPDWRGWLLGRHLRLFAWRPRLRIARLIAATGSRADLRDLVDAGRNRWGNGWGRSQTLRRDRQPHGLHRGFALRDRLAVTAQHSGAADQR